MQYLLLHQIYIYQAIKCTSNIGALFTGIVDYKNQQQNYQNETAQIYLYRKYYKQLINLHSIYHQFIIRNFFQQKVKCSSLSYSLTVFYSRSCASITISTSFMNQQFSPKYLKVTPRQLYFRTNIVISKLNKMALINNLSENISFKLQNIIFKLKQIQQ
ncbi:unnamed protein product (macronuclear) [Paramecium tetraurelia]|uniref:Transmembrane protein n=1 Tax=Paramecium tetraurelia TaxID=5888 RepID=A0DCQ8_PARTE|nr:uncharacterized protein GSPATT00039416001 [Paramecium tetraurelia]CAK80825.1 unnamed protein product [Paramecium tetraurelia]|eukprot:XP_001448222.1 hypothetical protein (macronuclear) [Paramecium tetraurelia strain d4-2]